MSCINTNSVEYQSLKKKAGIPENLLRAKCRISLEETGRFPHLDEILGVNSEPNLKDFLHIKKNGSASISNILELTGKDNIEDATKYINNEYKDLEISIYPIVDDAIVDIKHRPQTLSEVDKTIIPDKLVNSALFLRESLNRIMKLYGINIKLTTDRELNSDKWKNLIPNAQFVNAFIYNGEIYINIDRASVDAPIHELMHLLLGNMRFCNTNLYLELINSVESWSNYLYLLNLYPGRTRNDINEEIFVTEVSKLLTGEECNLSSMSSIIKNEIHYNVKRMIDTILMGQVSSRTISNNRLYNMSLKDIATEVHSDVMSNKFHGFFNEDNSSLHRKLNNIKAELIKNKLLKEVCE